MSSAPSRDPALLSASELIVLYRSKSLSPVEATKATLARIERFNGVVNAYCHLDADPALATARASEARWMAGSPLGLADGVPVGVKDNIAVAGMPARFGSKLTSANPLTFDAPAVARLKEQGAVILGKTAMPEYGWKAPVVDQLPPSAALWMPAMDSGGPIKTTTFWCWMRFLGILDSSRVQCPMT